MKVLLIVKTIIFMLSGSFCLSMLALENPSAQSPSTQGNSFVLPPVRRIGVDALETNIDKFRIFMRKQDRVLYGVPALPFNENEIRRELVNSLIEEVQNTGRFWELSLGDFLKLLPLSYGPKNAPENINSENLKRKLEMDYGLDAWVKPFVYFSPDQTLVRLLIKGAGKSGKIWAREDITLNALPTQQAIKDAFAQALVRIISTLGHDGRVTYERENLLTIDFGRERGIYRGQKLNVGYVLLTSYHPQTGEFLRSRRIPIHELKVLESREGSSLCQIVASDKIAYEQALKLTTQIDLQMLVWKPEKKYVGSGWREPYNPETAPILGAAEEGFLIPEQNNRLKPNSMIPSAIFDNGSKSNKNKMSPPSEDKDEKNTNDTRLAESTMQPVTEDQFKVRKQQQGLADPWLNREDNLVSGFATENKKSVLKLPASWNAESLRLGAGPNIGVRYSKTSGFPITLVNSVHAVANVEADSELNFYLRPYGSFSFYNSEEINGTSYNIGTSLLKVLWKSDTIGSSSIQAGGGLEYMGGQLSNSIEIVDLAIMGAARWKDAVTGFGSYELTGLLSLLEFVQAKPVWSFLAEAKPAQYLPNELSLFTSAKRYSNGWFEFSFGAMWEFLPTPSYPKPTP